MTRLILVLGLWLLAACSPDETLTKYGGANFDWRLIKIDNRLVSYHNVIRFDETGAVTGAGPCQTFTANQTAPYPWFVLENLSVSEPSEVACQLAKEDAAFFAALRDMTLVEVAGARLILSDDAGREMYFTGVANGG
ncbi:hypothetical protein shim_01630 [Shimia sp. SK013]|uniref:META domain-containing protein n=1 Tax=Shimia sp. SK013 TaxID=1389006 RepID=UPI0006B50D82|nr:META domain-containing protein [Shimia sp. SK013]KPA23555.1 hypothetical protein shim_01630 [Shimia sp. SK013]